MRAQSFRPGAGDPSEVVSVREQGRGLEEAEVAGAGNHLQAALGLELIHDVADVALDRAHCHHQLLGNRLVGVARRQQPQHLELTLRELLTAWPQRQVLGGQGREAAG